MRTSSASNLGLYYGKSDCRQVDSSKALSTPPGHASKTTCGSEPCTELPYNKKSLRWCVHLLMQAGNQNSKASVGRTCGRRPDGRIMPEAEVLLRMAQRCLGLPGVLEDKAYFLAGPAAPLCALPQLNMHRGQPTCRPTRRGQGNGRTTRRPISKRLYSTVIVSMKSRTSTIGRLQSSRVCVAQLVMHRSAGNRSLRKSLFGGLVYVYTLLFFLISPRPASRGARGPGAEDDGTSAPP